MPGADGCADEAGDVMPLRTPDDEGAAAEPPTPAKDGIEEPPTDGEATAADADEAEEAAY